MAPDLPSAWALDCSHSLPLQLRRTMIAAMAMVEVTIMARAHMDLAMVAAMAPTVAAAMTTIAVVATAIIPAETMAVTVMVDGNRLAN